MLLVQISDMHVTREGAGTSYSDDTGPLLARCLDDIRKLDPLPAAVLASGDLTNEGTSAEYARLHSLLAGLSMPVYVIPGNHDRREPLRQAFSDHAYLPASGEIRFAVTCGELRLVALDTLVEGEEGGRLSASQLRWLADTLACDADVPTVIAMHHPPFCTGIPRMDDIALDTVSAAQLGRIVQGNPQVQRVVCGHVHRNIHAAWNGVAVSVCPSTAFQTVLRFSNAPFAADASALPAYFVHHWNGRQLMTHTAHVG